MIPDHLIDKAWHAYVRSSNQQAIRNEVAHPDLRGPMPPPPDPRQSLRAALETVAADIWEDGYDAGSDDERAHLLGASLIDINQHTPNPYKASETA